MSFYKYKSDVFGHEVYLPEAALWASVIQRALLDWDKLEEDYREDVHEDLLMFFFSDSGSGDVSENPTLKYICESLLGWEHIIDHVRARCRLSDLATYIDDVDAREIRTRCLGCGEMKPTREMHKYYTCFNEVRQAKYCKACKRVAPTKRLMKLKRMERFIDALKAGQNTKQACASTFTHPVTYINWRKKDRDFRQLLKEGSIDLTGL